MLFPLALLKSSVIRAVVNRALTKLYKTSLLSRSHPVGPLRIEFSNPVSLDVVRKENPNLQNGGRFRPKDCVALQKVAIIIPFRNRDEHLKFWLYYLHPILQRQQLDYGIYVINQVSPSRPLSALCLPVWSSW